MELEDTDDVKTNLLKRSATHREELENEVRMLSDRTETILRNALIIGGTLAAAYFIARQFAGTSGKTKKSRRNKVTILPAAAAETSVEQEVDDSPGIMSQIGTALASQATIFLLGIAKEKLAEYLQKPEGEPETSNERT